MKDLDFDRFTRRLATVVGRREALKLFAGGALGGVVLTYLGCDAPGDVLGPEEEICIDPFNDHVTGASLEAGYAALAAGATEAKLSPGGCVRITRTYSGTEVVEEQLSIRGMPVMRMQKSPGSWTIRQDSDLDGFDEWQADLTLDAADAELRYVATEFNPSTRLPAHRQTLTPVGANVRVVLEEDRGMGLQVVGDFVRPPQHDAGCGTSEGTGASPCPPNCQPPCPAVAGTACSDAQCQQLKSQLFRALQDAVACLHDTLQSRKLSDRMLILAAWMPPIVCSDTMSEGHRASMKRPRLWPLFAEIHVNRDFFCSYDAACQQDTLIHELMHPMFPEHHPGKEGACRRHHVDSVYACSWICTRGKQNSTRTQCQVCLGVKDRCDDRCSSFPVLPPPSEADCYADPTDPARQRGTLGWECGEQWFETKGDCTAGCSAAGGCTPDRVHCPHLN
jgi:hypothetical protein